MTAERWHSQGARTKDGREGLSGPLSRPSRPRILSAVPDPPRERHGPCRTPRRVGRPLLVRTHPWGPNLFKRPTLHLRSLLRLLPPLRSPTSDFSLADPPAPTPTLSSSLPGRFFCPFLRRLPFDPRCRFVKLSRSPLLCPGPQLPFSPAFAFSFEP